MNKKLNDISKTIPIKFEYPENIESKFVTNIVVQNQQDHFIISFFEANLPPILGDTEEQKKELLDSIDSIPAKCVSKIIVTPQKMKDFIDVLSRNYNKFLEQ